MAFIRLCACAHPYMSMYIYMYASIIIQVKGYKGEWVVHKRWWKEAMWEGLEEGKEEGNDVS